MSPQSPSPAWAPDAHQAWLDSLALQAVVYAWPLYEMRRMWAATSPRKVESAGYAGDDPASAMRWCNTFIHTRQLLKAGTSRVVMPNNDTLYTNAWLDLSDGPLVIEVPAMDERYYVLGFLDFFTNPFAHVGTRTTGQAAGHILVTAPGWRGEVPPEFRAAGRQLQAPTPQVWIIGRILVDGEDDIANVAPLQNRFRIRTLADHLAGRDSPPRRFEADCDPRAKLGVEHFVTQVNRALADNPAPASDQALLASFGKVGIGLDRQAASACIARPEVAAALANALDSALGLLSEGRLRERHDARTAHAGWRQSLAVAGESFGHDFLGRAFVAHQGIGALSPQEAIYPRCETDAAGDLLHGAHRYEIRFAPDALPPVNAFWSITLYGVEDNMLVANPIDRYSIGDRTPGLRRDADGGLTLTLQHAMPPSSEARANWLPAPENGFFLCLRAYLPRAEMVDGRYRLPAPRRVD
ncbi:MAG: DUF1254 domain-containing protein [Burkholderiaceae bacterium]